MRLPTFKKLILFFVIIIASTVHFSFPSVAYAGNEMFRPDMSGVIDQLRQTAECSENNSGETCFAAGDTTHLQLSLVTGITSCLILPLDSKICPEENTATGVIKNAIVAAYSHQPASGIAFVKDTLANAGLADPTYAQGIGFTGLIPLLPFWKASRNIAYAALILVMVGIGFMVIFRMKIDPKTVISVQAALPKIVLTLLLITLSYPIVGFLIDVMYIALAIVFSIMLGGVGYSPTETANIQTKLMTGGIGQLIELVFLGQIENLVAGGVSGAGIGALIAALLHSPIIALVSSLIVVLIISLGLLYSLVRIALILFNSYIQILINVILGPIILLAEAVPGRSAFKDWLMDILANLVVFPAAALILMFAAILTKTPQGTGALWAPPLMGYDAGGIFHMFLGITTVFISPQLILQIKKQFHPKPLLPTTAGTAFSPLTGAISTGMGAMNQFYYAQMLWGGHGQPGVLQSIFQKVTGLAKRGE